MCTHVDVKFYHPTGVDGHLRADDTNAVESLEQRDAGNGTVVGIEAKLPDWLGQAVAVATSDALRWRNGLPRPDALVPIGGASGWDRQDRALC